MRQITIDLDRDTAKVALKLDTGALYGVGDVHFEQSGAARLDDAQLRRLITFAPGDPLTSDLVLGLQIAGARARAVTRRTLPLGRRWRRVLGVGLAAVLAPHAPALASLEASAKLSGSGALDSLSATASYRLSGLSLRDDAGNQTQLGGPIDGWLDATLAARLVTLKALDITHADTGTRVDASGSFDLDSRALALTARWHWRRTAKSARAATDPAANLAGGIRRQLL